MIIFVDFEKAFDTVSWDFLSKCLIAFNFGPYFQKCVSTLYSNILSSVLNNGYASAFFYPKRGIRQGCPLSALLFLLVVEVLSVSVKHNNRISGIKIGHKEYKITQLADDTTLFIADVASLNTVLNVLEIFRTCSGLKINRDKSEAIWIGASSNFRHKPCGLKWSDGMVKCLGILMGSDMDQVIESNFMEKIKKVENLLQMWSGRPLTLKGKITVIQNLVMPQLLYSCSVLFVPKWVMDKIHSMINNFLWNGKKPKIKHSTTIGKIEYGGLKLPDFESKLKAIKLAWVQRIFGDADHAWKQYLRISAKENINLMPFFQRKLKDLPKGINKFYRQIFSFWSEIYTTKVKDSKDAYNQVLWNNSLIRVDNQPIMYKAWVEKGILTIADLFDANGTILALDQLSEKHNLDIRFMDYCSLSNAIPKEWKNLIRNKQNDACNIDLIHGPMITIDSKCKKLIDFKCKDFYWFFIDKIFVKPTSEQKWQEKNNFVFDSEIWKHIYTVAYHVTRDTKLQSFQTKITHRIFACNYALNIWGKRDDNNCSFCNDNVDDILHYFIECKSVKPFWRSLFNWWFNISETNFQLEKCEMLFGVLNFNESKMLDVFNFLLLVAKWYIYTCKKDNLNLFFLNFLLEVKNNLELEKYIMYKNGNNREFDEKWALLCDNL